MAQNDTHVALIILTTQMWEGGGGLLVEKTFSGQNFVFLHLRRQQPFLHKTKGPTRNPISPTPPPSFGGRPCQPPPPPPPAEQFSGRPRIQRHPRKGGCMLQDAHAHQPLTCTHTWMRTDIHTHSPVLLLDFRSVRLQPTGWECCESAQVRSWSPLSLRSDNVQPPQGKCVDGAVHSIPAG